MMKIVLINVGVHQMVSTLIPLRNDKPKILALEPLYQQLDQCVRPGRTL
jgi:hypothetical protein